MTYADEQITSGRRPCALVEIDIDTCANTFGVNPCTAVLQGVGLECYNTFSTCQDKANYNRTTKTLRFCEDIAGLPVDFNAIPSIPRGGVTLDPTIIKPAKTLGIRAKTTITFNDHPYTDTTTDPYVITRTYDPLEQGTYWGKFIARNPNYEGRPLKVTIGYFDDDNVFQVNFTRLFIIDKIMGPDSNGQVKLEAKDILTLAENIKTKLPKANNGKLIADINDSVTSFDITAGEGANYSASGVLVVDTELMDFTRIGDTFTVVRGQYGSTADSHATDATVQECIAYDNENVIDIVEDILLRIGVDPAYIPYPEWEDERDDWLTLNNYTRIISKPTGVNKLLNEISQQSLISIWWDERVQEVKLKSMSPPLDISTIPTLNNDASFIRGSLKVDRLTNERKTRIYLYNELRDQTDDNQRTENYQQVNITIAGDEESADSFGDIREDIILGTWLTGVTDAVKNDILQKTINKFKVSPIKASFSCDAKDSTLWTGDPVFVVTDKIQTATGENATILLLVTKAQESQTGTRINYEATTEFGYVDQFGRWTADDAPNYLNANEEQRLTQGFWTNDDGTNPDGSNGTVWL